MKNNILEQYISYYNNLKNVHSSNLNAIGGILDDIEKGIWKKEVEAVRAASSKKEKTALKQKLPCVTFSGEFFPRTIEGLERHSGLICMDADGLQEWGEVSNELMKDIYVFALFVSPSGNGLKIIFKVDLHSEQIKGSPSYEADRNNITEMHGKYWAGIATYLKVTYGLECDPSGKDTSRLCFVSYDPDLFSNENSLVVDTTVLKKFSSLESVNTKKNASVKPKFKKVSDVVSDIDLLHRTRAFTDKIKTYEPSKRNDYINTFCYNAKRNGIAETLCESYCLQEFADYEDGIKALKKIVTSVYSNSSIVFGSTKKVNKKIQASKGVNAVNNTKQTTVNTSKIKVEDEAEETDEETEEYNETILFWYEVEKVDKDTGEVKIEHKFDHDGLTFFLANNGFNKLKFDSGYQFVHQSKGGLIEAVDLKDLNEFVKKYLHRLVTKNEDGFYDLENVHDELHEVRKMYKRGIKTYTSAPMYDSLPEIKPKFLKDNESASYLFFDNCYIEITATDRKCISYDGMKSHIWAKNRKKHHISLIDVKEIESSVVYQFVNNCILGEGSDDGRDPQRLRSMITTIGYLLDGYKDPTNTKAPVFQDKKQSSTHNDANGGSGKTLMAHIIAKMINLCLIDGKSFSFDSPYPYDTFKADQKLIVYNDVGRKFPFDRLFHKITEDFQYDKRYMDAVIIPQEDAPKHLVITNYSLMGEGSSFRRRQHIIEFTDFFNDEYTPGMHFGESTKDENGKTIYTKLHRFFTDWDVIEWNRFFNFMSYCVQEFKKHGLVPFPATNVKYNKLVNTCGEQFLDWMDGQLIGDEKEPAILPQGTKIERDRMFNSFKEQCREYAKMENSNTFSNWVKMWADMRNLAINAHKNGGKDKSGSTYYWTFTPILKK